jgi:hypothetical protein
MTQRWRFTLRFSDPGAPEQGLIATGHDRDHAEEKITDRMDAAGWSRAEWEIVKVDRLSEPVVAPYHG